VRVREQVLTPGVENAEDADLRAQMLGVGSDFQQGGSGGREQEMVKVTSVVLRQEVKLVGNGKDHVKVIRGQEFLFPSGKPTLARLGLALGAVPIATRIIRDGLKSALGAGIEVASERGGAQFSRARKALSCWKSKLAR